jgi:exoribonuclease R
MLEHAIQDKMPDYNRDLVSQIALHCNTRKAESRIAQDDSQKLYLTAYLTKHPTKELKGYVTKVNTRSLDIVLAEFGIEQTVWAEDVIDQIKGVGYAPGCLTIHWRSAVHSYKIFDSITVQVKAEMQPPSIRMILKDPSSSRHSAMNTAQK